MRGWKDRDFRLAASVIENSQNGLPHRVLYGKDCKRVLREPRSFKKHVSSASNGSRLTTPAQIEVHVALIMEKEPEHVANYGVLEQSDREIVANYEKFAKTDKKEVW